MTAAEVITFPSPRTPLITEMHDALDEALNTPDSDSQRKRFYTGLALGYGIAFGLIDRQVVERARTEPWSAAVHIDFRRPNGFDTDETLWACGVRHGYALGTSERPDAEECVTCGDRIVVADDDFERCEDGFFCGCGADCSRIFHANGPALCGNDE